MILGSNASLNFTFSLICFKYQIRSDQSLSRVWLFATLWTVVHQAPLSSTNLLPFAQIHVRWIADMM